MTVPNDDMERLKQADNILERIEKLEQRLNSSERSSIEPVNLSEMSPDLGEVRMGRFLATESDGDPTDENFSGVFMTADPETFGDDTYHLGGVNLGALQFGFSATTGKAYFCSGNAYIDVDGISGTDLLKWMIRQTASNDVYTRTGKLGMALAEGGGTIPNWQMSYESPVGAELVSNGGFETGDFTNWTKTTETNGVWSVSTDEKYEGTYSLKWLAFNNNSVGVLTSDRYSATAGFSYLIGGAFGKCSSQDLVKIEIKWYDHASAGSLISTDLLVTATSPLTPWVFTDGVFTAPTGALSFAIVITATDAGSVSLAYFDAITATAVTVNQKLWLADAGAGATNGLYPTESTMWWDEATSDTALAAAVNTSQMFNMLVGPNTDGAEFTFTKLLEEGYYALYTLGRTNTDCGKIDVYVNNSLDQAGQDWYNASAYNVTKRLYDVHIPKSGVNEIMFKVNGKHASSSAYYARLTKSVLVRNADQNTRTALIQPASADTYIAGSYATTNYSTSAVLTVGEWNGGTDVVRGLIKFDLSSISASATIVSAKLYLYLNSEASSNDRSMYVYRMLADWTASEATWNKRNSSTNWTAAGGFHASDCEQTDIGNIALSGSEAAGWKTITLTAAEVQDWTDESLANYGMMLKMATENNDQYKFHSSDYTTDITLRPYILITYTV